MKSSSGAETSFALLLHVGAAKQINGAIRQIIKTHARRLRPFHLASKSFGEMPWQHDEQWP